MKELSKELREVLGKVGTSTLTGVLNRRGLKSMTLFDVRPVRDEQPAMVGIAYTMRFIPSREDKDGPTSTNRSMIQPQAMEECPPGHVLMIDSRGDSRAVSGFHSPLCSCSTACVRSPPTPRPSTRTASTSSPAIDFTGQRHSRVTAPDVVVLTRGN